MRRPVYFVAYYDKGSTVMGGDQVSEALRARGLASRVVPAGELRGIADAILIFIKTSRLDHLVAARRRRNRIVLDLQDTIVFKRRIKHEWAFDGVIFKSARQHCDFASPARRDVIIYHQWDPRFRPNERPEGPFRIGYFGLRRSFPLWGAVPGVDCIDRGYFEQALPYNCHLSVRPPGRDFLYKPNCKVSTAAACAANLVTTPDPSTTELLGDDYPYYVEGDLPSIAAGIARARDSFGGRAWRDGLERMRAVRERTSMARIADDYDEYCRTLE